MIKILDNTFLPQETDIINNEILGDNFPWYLQKSSTSQDDIPFFSHVLVNRSNDRNTDGKVNSEYYYFFKSILDRISNNNNLNIDRIYRASLNLTYPTPNELHGVPHIDHNFPHRSCILYLNNSSGNTVLFKDPINNKLIITNEVEPKQGRAFFFNGMTYHSVRPSQGNDVRAICVFTFE